MKSTNYVLRKLYLIWCVLIFIISMIIYVPGIVLPFVVGKQKGGPIGCFFLKVWSWTFSKFTGISYRISGQEHIDKKKAYIYVSNHTSYLDLPGISLAIPTQFRPLAKKELKRIPIFNWIVQHATVVIDRSSIKSRNETMDKLKKILSMNISILIFPEGTQNRSPHLLQHFHDGAFRAAIETRHSILPITVINAGTLMPPHRIHIEPGIIDVIIGKPIETTNLKKDDIPKLKATVYDTIYDTLCISLINHPQ